MINISRKKNVLVIEPLIEEALSPLSFVHRRRDKVKKRVYSKKSGKYFTVLVDGPVISEVVPLFKIKDNKIITFAGLKKKLLEHLNSRFIEYNYTVEKDFDFEPRKDDYILEGLYEDQKEATIALLGTETGGMVEAATSAGKTHIIAGLCRAFEGRMGVVVTNKQSVAKRLYSALIELCPNSKIGIYISSLKKKGKVLVITAASLSKLDKQQVDFVIYDECHGASGEKRSEDLIKLSNARKYGLSATIYNEFTGGHNYLESIFGPIVYRLSDDEVVALGRAVPLDVYMMRVDQGMQPDAKTQDLTAERNGIWYNRHRNKIIQRCCELTPENQQVIVFVRTEYHLNHLKDFFLQDFEVYHGGLSAKEKTRVLNGFNSGEIKKIISTDSLAEGVDPKNLFVSINANWGYSPTSVIQKAGRNRRLAEGKTHGIVIDFEDNWHKKFERKAKKRAKEYENRNYSLFRNSTPESIKFVNV